MITTMTRSIFLLALVLTASSARGGEADVIGVQLKATGLHAFRFDVTLQHADAGWDHYADRWEIVGTDKTIIGTRVLAHPHVEEQTFTRSLPNVTLPAGTNRVTVRAHDLVHGYGGKTVTIDIPH